MMEVIKEKMGKIWIFTKYAVGGLVLLSLIVRFVGLFIDDQTKMSNEELNSCIESDSDCEKEVFRRTDSVYTAGSNQWADYLMQNFPSIQPEQFNQYSQSIDQDVALTQKRIGNIHSDIRQCIVDTIKNYEFFSTAYHINSENRSKYVDSYYTYALNEGCSFKYPMIASRFLDDAKDMGVLTDVKYDSIQKEIFSELKSEDVTYTKEWIKEHPNVRDVSVRFDANTQGVVFNVVLNFKPQMDVNYGFFAAALYAFHQAGCSPLKNYSAIRLVTINVKIQEPINMSLASITTNKKSLMALYDGFIGPKGIGLENDGSWLPEQIKDESINGVDYLRWCKSNGLYCTLGSINQNNI